MSAAATPVKAHHARWTDEQTEQLFEALAAHLGHAAVGAALGITEKAVVARVSALRRQGDPRAKAHYGRGRSRLPCPDDFVIHGAVERLPALVDRYGVSKSTIGNWRKLTGVYCHTPMPKARRGPAAHSVGTLTPRRPLPSNFCKMAPTMQRREVARYYDVSDHTADRWAKQAGVAFKRVINTAARGPSLALDRNDMRDMSLAGQAAEHLRRLGPIYRCDANGRADGEKTHWRRGSAILTADEVMDRARRNGWDADSWRRLAA